MPHTCTFCATQGETSPAWEVLPMRHLSDPDPCPHAAWHVDAAPLHTASDVDTALRCSSSLAGPQTALGMAEMQVSNQAHLLQLRQIRTWP